MQQPITLATCPAVFHDATIDNTWASTMVYTGVMKGKMKKLGKPLGASFGLLGAMAAIWWFALRPRRSKRNSTQDSDQSS